MSFSYLNSNNINSNNEIGIESNWYHMISQLINIISNQQTILQQMTYLSNYRYGYDEIKLCWYGVNCHYHQVGKCRYYHNDEVQPPKPAINPTKFPTKPQSNNQTNILTKFPINDSIKVPIINATYPIRNATKNLESNTRNKQTKSTKYLDEKLKNQIGNPAPKDKSNSKIDHEPPEKIHRLLDENKKINQRSHHQNANKQSGQNRPQFQKDTNGLPTGNIYFKFPLGCSDGKPNDNLILCDDDPTNKPSQNEYEDDKFFTGDDISLNAISTNDNNFYHEDDDNYAIEEEDVSHGNCGRSNRPHSYQSANVYGDTNDAPTIKILNDLLIASKNSDNNSPLWKPDGSWNF